MFPKIRKVFEGYRAALDKGEESRYLDILEEVKRLMSDENYVPVAEFVDSGLLPYVLHFITPAFRGSATHVDPALWYQLVTRILCNVCTGEVKYIEELLSRNFIEAMQGVVEAENLSVELFKTALHLLANLCSSNGPGLSAFLKSHLPRIIIDVYNKQTEPSRDIDYRMTWLFSNIVYLQDTLSFEEENDLVVLLAHIFMKYPYGSFAVLEMEASWGFTAYIKKTDNRATRISNIETSGILSKFVKIANMIAVSGADIYYVKPVLSLIGMAFSLDDDIVKKYLDLSLAQSILTFSKAQSTNISHDAFWTISNIMATKPDLIEMVATNDHFNWAKEILRIGPRSIRLEILIGLSNYFQNAYPEQVENTLCNHLKVNLNKSATR